MHAMITILSNPSKLKPVLKALKGLGIHQSVVIDGMGTSNFDKIYDTYRPAMESAILSVSEVAHYRKVIVSIAHNEEEIELAMDAVETLLGKDLKKPNTGIIFSVPMVNL